jgi:hypothetical protein
MTIGDFLKEIDSYYPSRDSEYLVHVEAESDDVIVNDGNIRDKYTITIPGADPTELPDHKVLIKITKSVKKLEYEAEIVDDEFPQDSDGIPGENPLDTRPSSRSSELMSKMNRRCN